MWSTSEYKASMVIGLYESLYAIKARAKISFCHVVAIRLDNLWDVRGTDVMSQIVEESNRRVLA